MSYRAVDPRPVGVSADPQRGYLSPAFLLIVVVSLAAAALCYLYAQQRTVGLAAVYTWLCFPILALPFSMRRGVTGFAHPWTVIFWLVLYSWIMRMTIAAMGPSTSDSMLLMFGGGPQDVIFGGLFLGSLGLVSFTVGYFLVMSAPRRQELAPRLQRWHRFDDVAAWKPRNMEFAAIVLLVVSAVALVLLQRTTSGDLLGKRFNDLQGGSASRTSSLQYGYLRLAYLSHAVFIMLLVFRLKFGRMPSPLLTLLLPLSAALAVAVPLLGNNRAGVAIIMVDVVMLQVLLAPKIARGRLVLGALAAVLAVAWMLRLRGTTERSFSDSLLSTFAGRDLFDIGKTARIFQTEPGQLDGQSLWGWLVFPVPEDLLPFDKPIWTGLGQYVWVNAYGGEPGVTGIPAGMIGELYLNIGTFGVVVGMLLFGVLIAACYRGIYPLLQERRIIGAVLFSIELVRLLMFGLSSDLGTGVLGSLSDFLPVLALLCFAAPRPRPTRGSLRPARGATRPYTAGRIGAGAARVQTDRPA